MQSHSIIYSIFLIFTGATVIATIALYARQALLIAYITLGLLFGPSGLALVSDASTIRDISQVGIIFLLFLLGLNLEPQDLRRVMKNATITTLLSSIIFAAVGFSIAALFNYSLTDSVLIAVAMMFSSTIIGLKLLPTSALHHQRMGEIIVSILLLQDIIAIIVLLLLQGLAKGDNPWLDIARLISSLPGLFVLAFLFSKYIINRLLIQFDQIKEYVFLLAIGWCLGIAQLAEHLSLSYEIGAFVAGVSLAANPIARYIAESLKPLRDFFLILFFFALGASFNPGALNQILLPALILALVAFLGKPLIFRQLLRREPEQERLASEIGVRLAQISEFSLLIAIVAVDTMLLSQKASYLIQTATLFTFMISSYWIVMRYPTPIAVNEQLRRD